MSTAIAMALVPLYLLAVALLGRFILKWLPEGRIKRLLSLRIPGHDPRPDLRK